MTFSGQSIAAFREQSPSPANKAALKIGESDCINHGTDGWNDLRWFVRDSPSCRLLFVHSEFVGLGPIHPASDIRQGENVVHYNEGKALDESSVLSEPCMYNREFSQ